MPPTSDGLRTVGVSLQRLVPDASQLDAIRDAVTRTHRATLLATELLNFYVRDRLENHDGGGLEGVCAANWLLSVYHAVTCGVRKSKDVPDLLAVRDAWMQPTSAPSSDGCSAGRGRSVR